MFIKYSILLTTLVFSSFANADFTENSFFELGVWFGGETIAVNPGGDNYSAGSGMLLAGGFAHTIFDNPDISNRNALGIRYQGAQIGEGENRGLILESTITHEWNPILIGAGLHVDLFNQVNDQFGNATKLNDSIGLVFNIEFIANEKVNFSLKYLITDYKSTDGAKYNGDQVGLTLVMKI